MMKPIPILIISLLIVSTFLVTPGCFDKETVSGTVTKKTESNGDGFVTLEKSDGSKDSYMLLSADYITIEVGDKVTLIPFAGGYWEIKQ